MTFRLPRGRNGVLPNQYLAAAVQDGIIFANDGPVPQSNIQPASVDLRLGPIAYRMRCSFLPAGKPVAERVTGSLVLEEISLAGDGAILAAGEPYLIPLKEHLRLPGGIRGRANPKSSTGRADVFTRVITDRSYRFDEIAPGYIGGLYLEVVPLSFRVRVKEDLTLNQLRLSVGHTELSDDQIVKFHEAQPLLFTPRAEIPSTKLSLANGLFLGLDLRGPGRVGYRTRDTPPMLDLSRVHEADPAEYWEEVRPREPKHIILKPRQFYLLMSYESVTIPPTLAAEMTAYDPTSGELRTHYAGFFDPGFGYDEGNRFHGSTAALEVRAHDVAFMVEHRQPVCKLTFEEMLERPTELYGKGIGSNYQQQTETLGKHFRVEESTSSTAATPEALRPGQLTLMDAQ